MKKFLFIASALAIVAGCAKVTTVSTEEPQEIAFEAYTYGATKAPITDNSFPTDWSMQVHAIYDGGVNDQYLGDKGTIFTKDDAQVGDKNVWHDATTTRYWPLTGTLTFNAIAPVSNTPDEVNLTPTENSNFFTYDGVSKSVTAIKATMDDNSTTQTDVLVAKTANSPKVESVSMTFKHALAQVVVSAGLAADAASGSNNEFTITVKQINLKNTYQEGNLTATQLQNNVVFGWETSDITPKDEIEIFNGSRELSTNAVVFDGVAANPGKAILVVPTLNDNVVLELVYDVTYPDPDNTTMEGVTGTIKLNTGKIDEHTTLSTWTAGTKYTYNLTFNGPKEILIAPEVKPWDDEEVTVPGL